MTKTERAAIERVNPEARYRRCLGHWCGHKEFFSTSAANRFCPKCEAKKNQIAQSSSGIRIVGGGDNWEG
jgi:Zn finger protein HypA/HybF involved in hydrogenase expression